jgi:N-acetylneuraminate synthase
MRQFAIEKRSVGVGAPCFIVAEMALAHDGSLGAAHSFVDAAAAAGVDAVKFQTHIAEAESTPGEPFRVKIFPQDASRYEYWKRTAFTAEQWAGLKQRADERGVAFLSTPFSIEAARLLRAIGTPAWKISSGDTNNLPMLHEIAGYRQPVLLSTGMSYLEEIDTAVELLREAGVPLLVYQCTNRYPCPPEHLGLNVLRLYQERYGLPVGLSDHSGTVAAGLAAAALGAASVEVHVTWDRRFFGPDVSSSITFDELGELVRGVRFIECAMSSPVAKDDNAAALGETRRLFTKSVAVRMPIDAGEIIMAEKLTLKKPGTGIPAKDFSKVVGKKARRRLAMDEILSWDDVT